MGVRINPCFGCPLREGCEQRDEFRKRVAGLGLRSATFRCQKLTDALRPGRRIMVTTPAIKVTSIGWGGDPINFHVDHLAVPATIVSADDCTFVCVIDPNHVYGASVDLMDAEPGDADLEKYRFRKRQHARRIVRFLDEPDLPLCWHKRIQRDGKCDCPAETKDQWGGTNGGCYCAQEAKLMRELAD